MSWEAESAGTGSTIYAPQKGPCTDPKANRQTTDASIKHGIGNQSDSVDGVFVQSLPVVFCLLCFDLKYSNY